MITRFFRQTYHVYQRTIPFLAILFTRRGLLSPEGRQLFRGKARRSFLSLVPFYARHLQRKYGISGGCNSCGASCKMMFQCPHWDDTTHLCSVYEDRPEICRLFPITPADLKDRDLVLKEVSCGFTFNKPNPK